MNVMQELRLKGAPVSDGVAIGELFFLPVDAEEVIPECEIDQELIESEITKYRTALDNSREDLLFLKFSLEKEGTTEALEIIEAHMQMLEDPLFTVHVEESIRGMKKNAEAIFSKAVREYEKKFSRIKDPFFQQRIVDVLDVSKRILGHLLQKYKIDVSEIPQSAIVFAKELVPSHTAAIQASRIGAFVTLHGGGSSHTALIARAKGIPYVSNIDFGALGVEGSAVIIVDGKNGDVIIHPSLETLEKYQEMKRRLRTTYRLLQQDIHPITETIDGYPVHIYANIGSLLDLQEVHAYKPEGIGLLRSEYLFLGKNTVFLSEEEQLQVYSQVVSEAQNLSLVMRVFDIGGDKNPDMFLEHEKEANPVLGCRGIRFLLKHPAIFRTQLRAIMRACKDVPAKLLLPLISDIQEIRDAKYLINQVHEELYKQGLITDRPFPVGCMIEVPSVVMLCDAVAKEVDFLSIGTNDLVQYTLGMDRSNPSMSEFFYPAHPSVIRMIKMVVIEAKRQSKPVTVCGEIASNPFFIPLLLGLGVSEFSCSPRHIPLVKRAVRRCVLIETFKLAQKVLLASSPAEVEGALVDLYKEELLER
ncbi:MAG: phosphoenolpyruvate--protein phosphotransferase [Verrucomicrobia bacterium]|nr:phosphoenolpyruvate--protein phosphotransferase [Verrucomicrobiota bacterium]